MRTIHPSMSPVRSCCQMRTTDQPRARSRRKLRASRFRFPRSFFRQNGDSLCSQTGRRQPCQKSPSTKTAIRSFEKTTSGLPGSFRTLHRYLKPCELSSRRRHISSGPLRSLTDFIARERCSRVIWPDFNPLRTLPVTAYFDLPTKVLTRAFIFSRTVLSLTFASSVSSAVCATASRIGLNSEASLANAACLFLS